jgi:histidinol-phosphate phosphatase family protein
MKRHRMNSLKNIDSNWTLFLDRDGVINKRIIDDYVLRWDQFEFLPGVLDAFKIFSSIFGKIIIVTNQQGIGKGYMTEAELLKIHSNMTSAINESAGKIDAVYFSPYLKESNHFTRKPNIGMALKAKKDFPLIDFKKSVMAGDSKSDMEFGHRLGMLNVYINASNKVALDNHKIVDMHFLNLKAFADNLMQNLNDK